MDLKDKNYDTELYKTNKLVLEGNIITISNWVHRDTLRGGIDEVHIHPKNRELITSNVFWRFDIIEDCEMKENEVILKSTSRDKVVVTITLI